MRNCKYLVVAFEKGQGPHFSSFGKDREGLYPCSENGRSVELRGPVREERSLSSNMLPSLLVKSRLQDKLVKIVGKY